MLNDFGASVFVSGFLFAFGCCIGSFLNVVAYRVPKGISVVAPRSHCPSCATPIGGIGLLPLLGYCFLLGRCRQCKVKISPQYPIVEALCGFATVFVVLHYFSSVEIMGLVSQNGIFPALELSKLAPCLGGLWFLYTGIPLAIIDIKLRILPNVIVIPGILIAFLFGGLNPQVGWWSASIGVFVGIFGLYAVAWLYEFIRRREGMGMGDVKYLGLIGGLVGWQGVIWTITLSSFAGSFIGIAYGIVKGTGLRSAIPFGPFLFLSGLIVHLYLDQLQLFFGG